MKLEDLLIKSSPAPKPLQQRFVNPTALEPVGITKPLEHPGKYLEPKPIVVKEISTSDGDILIYSMLSKFPHYKLVKKVYSNWVHKNKYIFLDTKRNIQVAFDKKAALEALQKATK